MPDIGRFFNIDPIAEDYKYNSPYAFAENKIGRGVELEGLELGPLFFFARPAPVVRPVLETAVRTQSGRPTWNPNATKAENLANMSRTGRTAHAERGTQWKSEGYKLEETLGKGSRADGIKIEKNGDGTSTGFVKELKPGSMTGRKAGFEQLARYVAEGQKKYPEVTEWAPELELYQITAPVDATKVDQSKNISPKELEKNRKDIEKEKQKAEWHEANDEYFANGGV